MKDGVRARYKLEFKQEAVRLVRVPQPCFSAALIAFVEAHHERDAAKNALCRTVPFAQDLKGYLSTNIVNLMNQGAWFGDEKLSTWIRQSRLDGFGKVIVSR